MIQDILKNRYEDCLEGLDIYENKNSLILSKIVIKESCRGTGIGTEVMNDLVEYADNNKQIIALTPSADFGGNKNRLVQFYKRFGFKHNKGIYKSYEFRDAMIRYPKINETKLLIKKLLREGLLAESYELVMYHDDVDLSEFNIDEYEAADDAHEIAKNGGVTILSDKELNAVLIDTKIPKVIGGLWISNNKDKFSFDIAIDSAYQNIGLSNKLITTAIHEFNYQREVYGDDLKMEVDVINPKLASILSKKYGFYKIADISQDRILMGLD